mmetsp:Transcript_127572/g.254887  ORF Transcript_127572/g.254887 Transcript_127572/m.254887 type:complete len:282 (-) Transcript_127572:520-1365(-)
MSFSRSTKSSQSSLCLSLSIWLCALVFRPSTVTRAISLCRFWVSTSSCCDSCWIFRIRFWLFAETRSQVVCSLVSSSIFETSPVISRETVCTFRSTTSMEWCVSWMPARSFVVSSTCWSMDCFSMPNWSMSRSRSCLIDVIAPCKCCISLSFRSRRLQSCSFRSCSFRVDCVRPRISFSTASSCSLCSCSACCTFCSASSRRVMPTREDRHCCISCFFSNSMLSICLPASRNVAIAASLSCFCATSCASSKAFCSVILLMSWFMLSMRTSCVCFTFSISLI